MVGIDCKSRSVIADCAADVDDVGTGDDGDASWEVECETLMRIVRGSLGRCNVVEGVLSKTWGFSSFIEPVVCEVVAIGVCESTIVALVLGTIFAVVGALEKSGLSPSKSSVISKIVSSPLISYRDPYTIKERENKPHIILQKAEAEMSVSPHNLKKSKA
eukprot:m.40300 g.40300  ORF g.40300 m.40300 type:complete len:160 (+) comp10421_c0_seq2:447-926(+)